MSANPQPAAPPTPEMQEQQYMTEEDAEAQFASVLWFEKLNEAGGTLAYQKQFVAILGEQIIAAAPTEDELNRLLDAMGDTIPQFRVVMRYVGSANDPLPM